MVHENMGMPSFKINMFITKLQPLKINKSAGAEEGGWRCEATEGGGSCHSEAAGGRK